MGGKLRILLATFVLLIVSSFYVVAVDEDPLFNNNARVSGYHSPLYADIIMTPGNIPNEGLAIEGYYILLESNANSWLLEANNATQRLFFRRGSGTVLVMDGANQRIGVGTVTPRSKLDVNGSVWVGVASDVNNPQVEVSDQGAFGRIQSYNGALSINPLGNNVGIGIDNPTQKLHVRGNTYVEGNTSSIGNSYFQGQVTIAGGPLNVAGNAQITSATISSNALIMGATNLSGGLYLGSPSSGTQGMLRMNGNNLQSWDSSVGQWVNVVPTSIWWPRADSTVCYGDTVIGNSDEPICVHAGGAQVIAANAYYSPNLGGAGGTDWGYIDNSPASGISLYGGNIGFISAPTGVAGSEVPWVESLKISSNGNVGIGVSNPVYSFEVSKESKFNGKINLPGGLNLGYITGSGSSGDLRFTGTGLELQDGTGWKKITVGEGSWVDCPSGICYKGENTFSSTSLWPTSTRALSPPSPFLVNPSSIFQHQALGNNDNYIYTSTTNNVDGRAIYGFDDTSTPTGNVISSVDIVASCRLESSGDGAYVSLGFYNNNQPANVITSSNLAIQYSGTTNTYNEFKFSKNINPWTLLPWTENDVNALEVRLGLKGGHRQICGGSGAPTSIEGNMNVLMFDGSYKKIKDIEEGDRVLTYDYDRKEFIENQVLRTVKGKKNVIKLNDKLMLSKDHLVYISGKGYVEAGNIKIGDYLINEAGLETPVYKISEESANSVEVYDFTVDYPNNFFAEGYLVHNDFDNCYHYYQSLRCRHLSIKVNYVSQEYKAEVSKYGNARFSGALSVGKGLFVEDDLNVKDGVYANSISVNTNLSVSIINANEISTNTISAGQIRAESFVSTAGQKVCVLDLDTGGYSYVNMPDDADYKDCINIMEKTVASLGKRYKMGCLYNDGSFYVSDWNNDLKGVPTSYPPMNYRCGWWDEVSYNLIYNKHTNTECLTKGGSVYNQNNHPAVCRFATSNDKCPDGWTQYGLLSTTTSQSFYGVQTCEEKPNGHLTCCPDKCTTGFHVFVQGGKEYCGYGVSAGTCGVGSSKITEVGCY